MKIVSVEGKGGHFELTIEIPDAYTDGSSRHEIVPINLSVLLALMAAGNDLPTKAELLTLLRRTVRIQRFLQGLAGEEF